MYPGSKLCLPDPQPLRTMKRADLKIRAPAGPGKWGATYKAAQRFSQEPLGQGCVSPLQQTKLCHPCGRPSTDVPLGKRRRRAQGCSLHLSARLLPLRVCYPWTIKRLVRQDSCGACSLPSSPCCSGSWRTSRGGLFLPAPEMLFPSTLSFVLLWLCSALFPKQGCSPRLVSAPMLSHSSNGKPSGHSMARNRWSPASVGSKRQVHER